MGRDKGLLELLGVPLVVRTRDLLAPLVISVTIIGPPQRLLGLGLDVIADQSSPAESSHSPSRGPLAGIVTALGRTSTPWNLIVACDLPYLSREWIKWLLARALDSQGDVVVPQTPWGLEPLAAVYRRECVTPIADALGRGLRRVTDALTQLRVEAIPAQQWRKHDPEGRVLQNMNTHQDYEQAQTWWEAKMAESVIRESGTT